MITCQNCGAVRPNGTQFCPNCGSPNVAATGSSPLIAAAKKPFPLVTIILSAIGVFFIASGQYGGSSWQWNGLTHNHPYYALAKASYFEAALGYLLVAVGLGIGLKALVSRIGVTAYVFTAIAIVAPIPIEILLGIQCHWDSDGFWEGQVWVNNWSTIVLTLSYELLAVALLVGGLVARSRSKR